MSLKLVPIATHSHSEPVYYIKKKWLKNIDYLRGRKGFCTIYDFMLSQFLDLLCTPGASWRENKLEGFVIEVALNSGLKQLRQESIVRLCLFLHPLHLSQTGLKWWEAQTQSGCWGRTTANGCTQQECTSANWSPVCWVGGCKTWTSEFEWATSGKKMDVVG